MADHCGSRAKARRGMRMIRHGGLLKSRAKRGNPVAARSFRAGNAKNLGALFVWELGKGKNQ
jgi:hypothetical protein